MSGNTEEPTVAQPIPASGGLSEARLLILLSLLEQPRHGYGMMQDVRRLGNSNIRLTNGTLYGALRELTAGGLIELADGEPSPQSKRRKQSYSLTSAGRALLNAELQKLRWLVSLGEERGLGSDGARNNGADRHD